MFGLIPKSIKRRIILTISNPKAVTLYNIDIFTSVWRSNAAGKKAIAIGSSKKTYKMTISINKFQKHNKVDSGEIILYFSSNWLRKLFKVPGL